MVDDFGLDRAGGERRGIFDWERRDILDEYRRVCVKIRERARVGGDGDRFGRDARSAGCVDEGQTRQRSQSNAGGFYYINCTVPILIVVALCFLLQRQCKSSVRR